jgi:hypothetical protein
MIEIIKQGEEVLAVIVKTDMINDSLKFVSPEDFPLQVGIQNKEPGGSTEAHEHLPFEKLENLKTQEIFFVESGLVEIGIYFNSKKVRNVTLSKNDLIILNTGHDLNFLEKTRLIIVKQGPYRGKEKEKSLIK